MLELESDYLGSLDKLEGLFFVLISHKFFKMKFSDIMFSIKATQSVCNQQIISVF